MAKRLSLTMLIFGLLFFAGSDVSAGASVSVKVKLHAAPGGMFLVGKPSRLILSPLRVTVGLFHGGVFRSRIFGMGHGRVVFAGLKAKPFHLHLKGPGLHVKMKPGGPPIKLGPGKGHGPKIKLKF